MYSQARFITTQPTMSDSGSSLPISHFSSDAAIKKPTPKMDTRCETEGNPNFIDRFRQNASRRLRIRNQMAREILAEIMGTAFLIVMGETGTASYILSRGVKGDVITCNFGWGFGVFFASLMAQNVSGAHFNPAVTITFAFLGRLPWKKVVPYILAQVFGAFIGAAITFATYYDAIQNFDGGIRHIDGPNGTAVIFSTYPQEFLSAWGSIFDQVAGTCSLLLAVLATSDPHNGLPKYLGPFAIAFYVTVNGWTFSYNSGGAINPARDLGPRIFTAMAGWGPEVFSYRNYWFLVPLLCPIVGGFLGGIIYNSLIGIHYPAVNPSADPTPSLTPMAKAIIDDVISKNIYLTQRSLEMLDSGKRESAIPLVRP